MSKKIGLIAWSIVTLLLIASCKDDSKVKDESNPVPDAPAGISAEAGDGEVTISWSDVEGADSYNLYWATEDDIDTLTGNLIEGVTSPYLHEDLTNGTAYYYAVTAVNSGGESGPSDVVMATPMAPEPEPEAPAAPEGVQAIGGDEEIEISWEPSSGATSYNIYFGTAPGVTKDDNLIDDVESPFVHGNRNAGQTYYYVVTAVGEGGESDESEEVSATTIPGVPQSLVAQAIGNERVQLTWDDVAGANAYNLYYSTDPGVTADAGTQVQDVTSPYTQSGLVDGATYYFVVTALNGSGESAESNEASAVVNQAFLEDFSDNSAGWILDDEWEIGSATAGGAAEGGNPDPDTDVTPTGDNGVAGVNIGGDYSETPNPHGFYFLTSPAIDLSGWVTSGEDVEIRFWRWLNSDYPGLSGTSYVRNIIQVYDGVDWVTIWLQPNDNVLITDNAWNEWVFDITAYLNSEFRIRFGFELLGSPAILSMSGWNLDDVVIKQEPPN